jgi:hypothetical protein
MKVGEAFTGAYLKADTFMGKRVALTCDHVEIEKVGEDTKPVLYFAGKEMGLVLNKTNANMIAEIAGDDEMDNWKGVRIALYGTKTDYQGKRVNAMRVDYPPTAGAAQKPPPPPEPVSDLTVDDIPF